MVDDAVGDPNATPEPLERIAKRPYKIEVRWNVMGNQIINYSIHTYSLIVY